MVIPVLKEPSGLSQELAVKLNLPLVEDVPDEYYLAYEDKQWVVKDSRQGPNFSIRMNLANELEVLKKQRVNLKKDLLCRALGFKPEARNLVLDGTLGVARDAIHIIASGGEVIGYEKNPITFTLLESALEQSPEIKKHLSIYEGDCLEGVKEHGQQVDCMYLDPMFENVKKKSAPKKSLAFLREISPVDIDVQRVIQSSIALGIKRLVVKRPLSSEHLHGKPNIVYEGKLIRYDVYTR